MSAITLEQAAQWCGGVIDPKYKDVTFFGANNDSRKVTPGQLFLALSGQRDGHDFIPMALEKGAAAVLCTHCEGDYPAIVVPDTRKALGDIARQERRRLGAKVIGITGSVGKSTTKEMTVAVLEQKYTVGKTPVNHNNDIGMPMAILAMEPDVEVAVLEMGMNHFGEMSYLTSIAEPDIVVITNIGTMHIEHLGSREGILKAKLEILEGLQPGGAVVFNGDEPLLWKQRENCPQPLVYFGMENDRCAVRGSGFIQEQGQLEFSVSAAGTDFEIVMPLEGIHFAVDALAAIAVGELLEVPVMQMRQALADFRSMESRQQIIKTDAYTIIKDCYNAGPESMAAALAVLGKHPGRRVAVLGDMLELGACTQAEHYRVGRIAAANCDLILALGKNAGRVVSGAITGGMRPDKVMACAVMEELIELLSSRVKPGDTILFKGSRGMRMERALESFLQEK